MLLSSVEKEKVKFPNYGHISIKVSKDQDLQTLKVHDVMHPKVLKIIIERINLQRSAWASNRTQNNKSLISFC